MTLMTFDCPDEMNEQDKLREKSLFEQWARDSVNNGNFATANRFYYVADNYFKLEQKSL